jgi:hypothetical protein
MGTPSVSRIAQPSATASKMTPPARRSGSRPACPPSATETLRPSTRRLGQPSTLPPYRTCWRGAAYSTLTRRRLRWLGEEYDLPYKERTHSRFAWDRGRWKHGFQSNSRWGRRLCRFACDFARRRRGGLLAILRYLRQLARDYIDVKSRVFVWYMSSIIFLI